MPRLNSLLPLCPILSKKGIILAQHYLLIIIHLILIFQVLTCNWNFIAEFIWKLELVDWSTPTPSFPPSLPPLPYYK